MSLDTPSVLTEPVPPDTGEASVRTVTQTATQAIVLLGKNRTRNPLLKSNPAVIIGYLNHLPAIKCIS